LHGRASNKSTLNSRESFFYSAETRKTDYGRSGPLELGAIEKATEGVARDIDWQKVD
jgi:hypothetical protein